MFELPSLENRRLYLSLSNFYKIMYNLVYFPPHYLPTLRSSSSSRHKHQCQYHTPFAHSNQLKHSFLPTCISLWNNLPIDSKSCITYVAFKSHIAHSLYNTFMYCLLSFCSYMSYWVRTCISCSYLCILCIIA